MKASTGMGMGSLAAGFVAMCAMGCAAPARAPVVAAPVHIAPTQDTTGLTYLLAPELDPAETRREVTNVLRREMQAAGYHVVSEPKGNWDVELIPRVEVWGREFELAKNPTDAPDVHEHIKLTVTAVALHEIVGTSKFEFTATNSKVGGDDVNPALNALQTSPKFHVFSDKVLHDREAHSQVASAK